MVIAEEVPFEDHTLPVIMISTNQLFCNTPGLNSITWPASIKEVYLRIENSSIAEIIFPETDLEVGILDFTDCPNLKEVCFKGETTTFQHHSITRYDGRLVFEGNTVFYHAAVTSTPVIEWGPGTHRFMMRGVNLPGTHAKLPENVLLEEYALTGEMTTLEIGEEGINDAPLADADQHFGRCIFYYCSRLKNLIIHNRTPRTVHPQAFKNIYHNNGELAAPAKDREYAATDASEEDEDLFLKQVTLYVPAEAVETYRAHPQWGRFANIRAITDGVDDITADSDGTATPQWFNLQGQPVDSPCPGQLLLKRTGNRTRKVLLK